jgi:hypothetical protein
MQVAKIIGLEEANTACVYLLKEGLFYRAYNHSAMRVVRYLKPYKINRKYVKKVQQEIFYIGFPEGSLEAILQQAKNKGWQIKEQEDENEVLCLTGLFDKTDDYEAWIKDLPISEKETTVEADTAQTRAFDIIKQIESFQIENATPMDAILFVNKLKQQIRNGNV